MTAEITWLYKTMPQELCQAEANEAAACALAGARAQWSENRDAQQALDAANIKQIRRENRITIACIAAAFLAVAMAVTIGQVTTSVWTVSNAAYLAR